MPTCSLVAIPQLARVGVSAEEWQAFRQLALRRGLSVTAYLGKLVEQELRRHARTNLAEIPADVPPRDEAIAALEDVRRSIDELDDVAGRLARSALAHGATWADVGSSLRLGAAVADLRPSGLLSRLPSSVGAAPFTRMQ